MPSPAARCICSDTTLAWTTVQAPAESKREEKEPALEPQQRLCTIESQLCPAAELFLKCALVLLRLQC